MDVSEHFSADLLQFFDRKPAELALYQALQRRLEARFPDASARVQKSQISFYGRHLFAMVSLRRRRSWPRGCIVLTLGLPRRLPSPRAAEAVEPYPGRWTNHIPLAAEAEIDDELLGWVQEAWDFAEAKR